MSELAVGSLAGLAANSYVIDVASGSKLRQPGQIIAVESVLKTDTFSASVASGGNVAVTDLSITHALENASNKLLITSYFGVAGSSDGLGSVGIAVADDGTVVGVGDTAGNRARVGAGGRITTTASSILINSLSVTFVYEPGDTSSHTYTVRAINPSESTQTLYINQSQNTDDVVNRVRGASSLVIQEVAV